MTDEQIRREYFRRVNTMLATGAAIGSVAYLPLALVFRTVPSPLKFWVMMAAIFFAGAMVFGGLIFLLKRNRPLFTAKDIHTPPSLVWTLAYGAFFLIFIIFTPKVLDGRGIPWQENLQSFLYLAIIAVPAWIPYWKWRDQVLRSLPANSPLVEQPKAVKT